MMAQIAMDACVAYVTPHYIGMMAQIAMDACVAFVMFRYVTLRSHDAPSSYP